MQRQRFSGPRLGPNGKPRCETHVDWSLWVDTPHPKRPGFTRTTCKLCGVWIGDRPDKGDALLKV